MSPPRLKGRCRSNDALLIWESIEREREKEEKEVSRFISQTGEITLRVFDEEATQPNPSVSYENNERLQKDLRVPPDSGNDSAQMP